MKPQCSILLEPTGGFGPSSTRRAASARGAKGASRYAFWA